jgi:hypothetical protein
METTDKCCFCGVERVGYGEDQPELILLAENREWACEPCYYGYYVNDMPHSNEPF